MFAKAQIDLEKLNPDTTFFKDECFLKKFTTFACNEADTLTRREAVSAIGRMRSEKAIPILTQFLIDADPKVVLQGLRGLLCFKGHPEAEKTLATLREHPNEMIREHFEVELLGA